MAPKRNPAPRKTSGKSSRNTAQAKAVKGKFSMTFARNSNILVAENVTESNDAPSRLKIMIRPSSGGLKAAGPAQQLSPSAKVNPAPSRVQPSRANKANKMAKILDEMEVDDDATTSLPGRRKRRIEDGPEQFSTTPDDVERNPMAPVKRRKQDASVRPQDVPVQLPLQPALPEQIPPSRSSQPRTQPPQSATDARPQVQCQYQAQPAEPHSQRQQPAEPRLQHQPSLFHSEAQYWSAQQPDPRQIQTLPDNEARYHEPEAQLHISEDRSTSNSHRSFQTSGAQPHPPRNTAIIDEPRPRAATDQPQMDRQENDGHDDDGIYDETGDQYWEGNERSSDDIYGTPRQSDYRPQHLSQSPHLRPEGLFTYFSIFIYLSVILDIDEESPSEADEAARRALRSISPDNQAGLQWQDVTDVLQEHRTRNRANKPPKDQPLLDAARKQLAGPDSDKEDDEDDNGDDDDDDKTNSNGNPKTLKYYSSSGVWVTAITKAKEVFRRFTMLSNLFPLRDSRLQDAAGILSKVIADLKEEDTTLVFDRRKFFYYHLFTILSLSTEYHQNRDMNIVVRHYYIISISYYVYPYLLGLQRSSNVSE